MQIETERLVLRRPIRTDIDALIDIHADPEVEQFMDRYGRHELNAWLARVDANWDDLGYGRLVIEDRESHNLLGRTGLMYAADYGHAELGWTLHRRAWGHGYATEAAQACKQWALEKLGLTCVIALIEPANTRSVRIAERIGMTQWQEVIAYDRQMTIYGTPSPRPVLHKQDNPPQL